jgi:hypothetical protein
MSRIRSINGDECMAQSKWRAVDRSHVRLAYNANGDTYRWLTDITGAGSAVEHMYRQHTARGRPVACAPRPQ